jgi:hypothetical protein
MAYREVAEAVSHALKPEPENLDASRNVWSSVTTSDTFQPDRSEFISLAW